MHEIACSYVDPDTKLSNYLPCCLLFLKFSCIWDSLQVFDHIFLGCFSELLKRMEVWMETDGYGEVGLNDSRRETGVGTVQMCCHKVSGSVYEGRCDSRDCSFSERGKKLRLDSYAVDMCEDLSLLDIGWMKR